MNNIPFERGAISAGDCVSSAWSLVSLKMWMYIGVGFITLLMIGCIPILNIFLMGPVLAGFYEVALRDMRDEPVDFGMMFNGFKKFVPLMLIGLIQSIPAVIWQIIQLTVDIARLAGLPSAGRGRSIEYFQSSGPGAAAAGISVVIIIVGIVVFLAMIAWTIAFQFAIPLVLEHDLGVMEAISLSARAGFSNTGGIIVLYILCGLVGILGLLALCVGYFVAIPVTYAAMAFAYRQVFPMIERNINLTPPPPTAYGFGGGPQY